jgi:hypothetical protein
MMKNKSTFINKVAVLRYRPDPNALNDALNLRRGPTILSNTRIVNKPKNISWKDTDHCRHSIQGILSKGENNGI